MTHWLKSTPALRARRPGLVGWALAALSIGALAACDRGAPQASGPRERESIEVRTAPVERRAVDRTVRISGTLFGREEAMLAAKVGGRVTQVLLDVGDEAPAGAAAVQIDRVEFDLALAERRSALASALAKLGLAEMPGDGFDPASVPTVARAKAEAANALARFDRAKSLFEQSPPLLSEQDYSDIRTQSEVAARTADVELLNAKTVLAEARTQAAMIASSQQRLDETAIRVPELASGPITYRVAQRLVSVGEMVTAGQAVARVVATDIIKFRGQVPEQYASQVSTGQTASVRVDSFEAPFAGKVTRVSPRIEPRSRSFEVEIEIANPDGKLKPGAFARAAVVIGNDPGAAFVPKAALATFAGVQRVYSVKDGKAVEHQITAGEPAGDMIEISGKVPQGEVISPATSMSNGQPVRVTTVVKPG